MTKDTKKKISKAKTKYDPKYDQKILNYFAKLLSTRTKTGAIEKLPSYAEFSRKINVTVRTLENWRKTHPSFGEACEQCDELFKAVLIGDCLQFRMHAGFGKFVLSSRYGMKEKVEVTTDENAKVEISPELAELLQRRRERDKT